MVIYFQMIQRGCWFYSFLTTVTNLTSAIVKIVAIKKHLVTAKSDLYERRGSLGYRVPSILLVRILLCQACDDTWYRPIAERNRCRTRKYRITFSNGFFHRNNAKKLMYPVELERVNCTAHCEHKCAHSLTSP